jgi:hypothetical protein
MNTVAMVTSACFDEVTAEVKLGARNLTGYPDNRKLENRYGP